MTSTLADTSSAASRSHPLLGRLEPLADRAWTELERVRERHPAAIPPVCAPVLWFGDAKAYADSDLRVATVGLNPSDREFPGEDPWRRFPHAGDRPSYLDALCDYFEVHPLDWFTCFGRALRGLNASFSPGALNRAVHTDICSVVPTSPTWSQLPSAVRRDLSSAGLPLWHDLVAALRPHVILASVSYPWLDRIRFAALSEWEPVHVVARLNPYVVQGRRLRLPDGSTTLLVRGRAAHTPFGTVSNADRYLIGRSVRRFL